MMLPKRRPPTRSGIQRAPERVWPRHRKWVRSHGCCVPGCEDGPIEFAHVRSAANSGTGLRPHDAFAISLCRAHHAEQHRIGVKSFEDKYNLDMGLAAIEFTRKSPDRAMRESLKLAEGT